MKRSSMKSRENHLINMSFLCPITNGVVGGAAAHDRMGSGLG